MRQNEIRLNHVLFPFGFLLLWPSFWWALVLPVNFLWTGFVLFCTLKILRVNGVRRTLRKSLVKTFVFGLATDGIITGLLFLARCSWSDWWKEYISVPLAGNPYDNWYVLFLTIGAILVGGLLNYLFYYEFVFRRIDLERIKKRAISSVAAVCTMPFLLLIPAEMFQRDSGYYMFTNHILSADYSSVEIEKIVDGEEAADAIIYSDVDDLAKIINRAIPEDSFPAEIQNVSYRFWFPASKEGDAGKVDLYFEDEERNRAFVKFEDKIYSVREEDSEKIASLILGLEEREFNYRYMIVDQTVVADTTPEFLTTDGQYNYYLSSQRSGQIILVFENGGVLSLREALELEMVDVYDLIRNGLNVIPVLVEQDEAFWEQIENSRMGTEESEESSD